MNKQKKKAATKRLAIATLDDGLELSITPKIGF